MAEGNGNGGVAKWSAWAGVGTLGFALIGALFILYATAIGAAKDVSSIDTQVKMLQTQAVEDRVQLSTICAHLIEIETQFRGSDQIRNLMHVNDLRIQAMLWQKVYKEPYPSEGPYLPTIAQDQVSACK